jgi:hypothetical protein
MDLIRDALEHSSRSIHHPHCRSRRSVAGCDCHVGKAQAALQTLATPSAETAPPSADIAGRR